MRDCVTVFNARIHWSIPAVEAMRKVYLDLVDKGPAELEFCFAPAASSSFGDDLVMLPPAGDADDFERAIREAQKRDLWYLHVHLVGPAHDGALSKTVAPAVSRPGLLVEKADDCDDAVFAVMPGGTLVHALELVNDLLADAADLAGRHPADPVAARISAAMPLVSEIVNMD